MEVSNNMLVFEDRAEQGIEDLPNPETSDLTTN